MTPNKKQSKSIFNKYGFLIPLFIFPNFFICNQSVGQESYKFSEMEINRTINLDDENNFDLPSNPFEIVDKIRRVNSMNDATKPSKAIDEALKSFDMIKEEKQM